MISLLLQVLLKPVHFPLQRLSEVLEGDNHDGDVVEASLCDR